jgi:hypothetical protein
MNQTIMRTTKFISLVAIFISAAGYAMAQSTIQGSPYLNDAYASAQVISPTQKQNFNVRYNVYQDVMEYQQNGQPYGFDPNSKLKKVVLGEETYVIRKFEFEGKTKLGFVSLLDSGKVMLYAKKVVKFQDVKKGGNLDGTDSPAKYSHNADAYYYSIGNGELKRIENLKTFVAGFPDKNDELTTYAKKEKISAKKEKDLIQIVKYYDGLFEE